MKQRRWAILSATAGALLLGAGRPAPCDAALTLEQAVAAALANNPALQEAQAARDEAHFALREKSAQRLPRVSAVGDYVTSDDSTTQLPDSNQAVIRGDETVFQKSLNGEVARLRRLEAGASAELEQRRLETVIDVQQAYYQAVAAAEILQVWDDAQKEFSQVLKFLAPKFNIGSVPEYDYAKIRLTISQYRQSRLDTEKNLSHNLYVLGEVTGGEPPTEVAPLPAVAPPAPLDGPTMLSAALRDRPDVRAARAAADAERAGLRGARGERWPVARVGADYGYSGQTANDLSLGWGFDAHLNLPLFDFGEIGARIRQADARSRAQASRFESLKLKARTDMNDRVLSVRAAWEKLQLIQEGLPEAKKAYESSFRRYRTSLAPVTELSDAHDLFVQARITFSQALLEYRTALAELVAAQGQAPR